MSSVVMDASVLVAILLDEERARNVIPYLDREIYVSTVNVAEIAEVLRRKNEKITPDVIRAYLEKLKVNVVPFSAHQAFVAANFARITRSKGLSLGDNACLALASDLGAQVLTSDAVWEMLDVKIIITIIRK